MPASPASTTPDQTSGDRDVNDQLRDLGIGQEVHTGPLRRRQSTQQSGIQCMRIESDEDEFVFIYEIWIALWYVQSDLLRIRDYLAVF